MEVADLGGHVAVRDSKAIGHRPLLFSKVAMGALVKWSGREQVIERTC
ncbi:hypothetical protein [Streptomyces sp. NPDC048419]